MAVFLRNLSVGSSRYHARPTYIVHGQIGRCAQKQSVFPFPDHDTVSLVLDSFVLLGIFYELDKYEGIDLASPRFLAVHAAGLV